MDATREERAFQMQHHGKVDAMPATFNRLRTLLHESNCDSGVYAVLEGMIELMEDTLPLIPIKS